MIFERAIVLAKIEGSYGVNSVPDATNDAFITTVPTFTPLGDHRERNVARAGFAAPAGVNVGQGLQVEFAVELVGTAELNDEPPKIFRLLRACGMTQTIVSLVSATLTPNSNHDGESLSMIVNFDGTQHLLLGCRGSYTIDFTNNDKVMINFTFQGKYAGTHATAVAFPTGTFNDTLEKLIFRGANLDLNSVTTLVFENISFNPGINVFRRPGSSDASGTHAYSIVGRAAEATLEPEMVALATLDPWALYHASTQFDVVWEVADLNDTPGQQFTFSMFNCQLKEPPAYGQRESIRTWPITIKASGTISDGNDDFTISVTLPTES